MSMRIIAGYLKRTKLEDSSHITTTRPTTDRTREALFNIIESRYNNHLKGHFVDLFAGTGAVGLEALSRGAKHVTFIENQKDILNILKKNIANCKANHTTTIIARDALTPPLLSEISILFIDPPYHTINMSYLLEHYTLSPTITNNTLIIVQCAKDETFEIPPILECYDHRKYGYNHFLFLGLSNQSP